MSRRIDDATVYYWRIEFIDPTDPDDDRYVVLHGDEGEVVGPMTMGLAVAWMDHFDNRPQAWPSNAAPQPRAVTQNAPQAGKPVVPAAG